VTSEIEIVTEMDTVATEVTDLARGNDETGREIDLGTETETLVTEIDLATEGGRRRNLAGVTARPAAAAVAAATTPTPRSALTTAPC